MNGADVHGHVVVPHDPSLYQAAAPPALVPTHGLVAFAPGAVTHANGATERQLVAREATKESQTARVMKPIEEPLGLVWVEEDATRVPLPGLYLADVEEGSGAWRCGVQVHVGQRLTHVNQQAVWCVQDVLTMVNTGLDYTHGTHTVAFHFALETPLAHLVDRFHMHHPAKTVQIPARLLHPSPEQVLADDVKVTKRSGELLGCVVCAMRVTSVNRNSPAEAHNLEKYAGMYLTHINGVPVTDMADVQRITEAETVYLRFGAHPSPTMSAEAIAGSPLLRIPGGAVVPSSGGFAPDGGRRSMTPASHASPVSFRYSAVGSPLSQAPTAAPPAEGSPGARTHHSSVGRGASVVPHDPAEAHNLAAVTNFWL